MTGNPLLDLLISLAGTLLLVGMSYALGALRSVAVDEAVAADRLGFDEPDFDPSSWLVSEDRRAAAAVDRHGRDFAVVFALGDGLATRRLRAGAVRVLQNGRSVHVVLNEISKREVRLVAADDAVAAAWAGRLSKPDLD